MHVSARAIKVFSVLALAVLSCSSPEEGTSAAGDSTGGSSGPGSVSGTPDREAEAQARTEYEDRLFDCLRDQGLRVDESGENPEIYGDDAQIQAALTACEQIVGPEPVPAPPTDEEITNLYEQSLQAAACLEGLGYTISEPPSLEEFIESVRLAGQGGPPQWSPHGEVQGGLEQCPQPTLY